ncbi:DUF2254 domain-containing protein [Aurantiacibacter spongiae]|uniref:DUF2254 domain-containing protein n=1 Tax=Aurantiacibacter spongiae TaxID=2488860 RepID=A0A3N5CUA7_9SPHN|nr:DUF2254 domain-containing protein [Aurantiacibacter spongiae]RPF71916.1 DUF2254 domain-containing protein [Aurantiacibacter spongiae]
MTRLRAFWHEVNASYWFYPALFSILAVMLAFATIWMDRQGWAGFLGDIPSLIPARPDGASNMLTVIAGSMIGVASTVFSITIAAVAYASGNYGPRLLTNFMEDRGNQLSLAVFIATFVYALVVLRSVRGGDEAPTDLTEAVADAIPGFVPQLSLLVAFALTGVAVAVLVYFLNHIPASIRINTVLKGIGQRLLDQIDHRFPDEADGDERPEKPKGKPIRCAGTGYIQLIDYDALQSVAHDHGGDIVMDVRVGDFVHAAVAIADWCPREDGDAEPPYAAIRDCYAMGSRRTPSQDLNFLVDELAEIALRALSPGINDPFTAITALHWMGAAVAELGQRDLRHDLHIENVAPGASRVWPLNDTFQDYVDRGFGAIRSGAATNRIAAGVFLDVLGDAATLIGARERRACLLREANLLREQARLELRGPELEEVEARYDLALKILAREGLEATLDGL